MENKNTYDDLAKKITGLLPGDLQQVQQDLESNIKALLQNSLSKMNLVTREEFDVQAALLSRTREKLEQLEKQLSELEKNR
jgi:BMFP domain-containing protein YqiC